MSNSKDLEDQVPHRDPHLQDKEFPDLDREDLREWLDLPVTKLLHRHLVSRREHHRDAITDYVIEGKDDKVRLAAAGVRVLEEIAGLFHPPERRPVEPEEPFVDPGAIPPPPRGAVKP